MAYTANFTIFSKRLNSTKQPGGGQSWDAVSCKYKDGSDLDNPTLIVDWSGVVGATPETYNYVWMQSRFYFIQSRSYRLGLYEYQLKLDVLATYKSQLASQSFYIIRASTNYNTFLLDEQYPMTGIVTHNANHVNTDYKSTYANGYFVLGVINGDSTGYGAVSYYVMTPGTLRNLAGYLLGTTAYWGVTEITDQLLKCLYSPFQYIVSCVWYPFLPPQDTGTTYTTIKVGWWDVVTQGCRKLNSNPIAGGQFSMTIPKHPNTSLLVNDPDPTTNRKYLQLEPFSRYYLYLPVFGTISLPSEQLIDKQYLLCSWTCDAITGDAQLSLEAYNTGDSTGLGVFNILHGKMGCEIKLAQLAPNVEGAITQAGEKVSRFGKPGSMLNNLVTGSVETAGKIGTIAANQYVPVQTIGTTGGFVEYSKQASLYATFNYTADENLAEFGRPTCKTLQLSLLSGFNQCKNPDVILSGATRPATEEVISMLENGFFWE